MKYREVESRLKVLGCVEIARHGGGSHRKWFNPVPQRGAVVPDWGSKDLKIGTVRAAVR
jgi:predicted RNA binding protein YcfA (HicA-like mRNA interferase family)